MDKDLLYRFFEGRASIQEMKRIKEWSEASAENKDLFRRERKLFNAMVVTGYSKKPINYPAKTGKQYWLKESLKIASVVAVTIGIMITLFSINREKEKVNIAMHTITVPPGQRVNITLPDGSDVWLNAGTKMQYPLSFMKDKREIILDGEAYFKIIHNETCPFIVHTYAIDIEVLGTTFNVAAYSEIQLFEASLLEGKIKLESPGNNEAPLILQPDYKATFLNDKLVVSEIDDYNVYQWTKGLYCFKSKPFADIMKDLERYYDLKIHIDKKTIENIVLTGKFRISDGLDYCLRVLQTDVNFTYYRDKEKDIIYIK